MSHFYSKSHLLSSPAVSGLMCELIRSHLVPFLRQHVESGTSFDAMSLHKAASMDFATAYFFGFSNGTKHVSNESVRAERCENYGSSRPVSSMIWRHELPAVERLLQRCHIYPIPKSHKAAWDIIDEWCLTMCDGAEQALANPKIYESVPAEYPSVYHHLMNALGKEGWGNTTTIRGNSMGLAKPDEEWRQRSLQQLEVASELLDQPIAALLAAHDTMSATLTYVFYEVSRHSAVQRKLQEQLHSLGNGVRFDFADDLPTANAIDNLPYLHAGLMETMRPRPAIAGGQPRLTPSGQLTRIAKYPDIPAGVRVQAYALCLHQNPDVFPEPEHFQPERWLSNGNDENAKVRARRSVCSGRSARAAECVLAALC